MGDEEYHKKLESLQRYIPFLVNMMTELKAKGNREAQLTKIQSLHDMITDTRKKLKLETLRRCEEVLTNIYFKVNPQLRATKGSAKVESPKTLPGIESPRSTPQSPSPTRDVLPTAPVNIPTEKVDVQLSGSSRGSPKKSGPKIEVYSNAVISNPSPLKNAAIAARAPDMSKPPISLDDLKTLEDDVQQKITDATFVNKSVDELQEVKKQLQLQLRVDQVTATMSPEKLTSESINTTVRNTPTLSKIPSFSESRAKLNELSKSAKNTTSPIKDKTTKEATNTKSPRKPPTKETVDIFGNLLASIDDKIVEQKKKKKSDRRSSLSKEDSGSTTSLSSDKSDIKETETKTGKSSSDKHRHKDKKRDGSKDSKSSKSRSESKDNKKNDSDRKVQPKPNKQEVPETPDVKSSSDVNLKVAEPPPKEDASEAKPSAIAEPPVDNNAPKPAPMYRRLADKYNPKPKQKNPDADISDVDKSVSDSIEQRMKVSPVKSLPLILPTKISPPVTFTSPLSAEQTKPVQLPDILQKIFSKPLLGDIIPKTLNEPIGPPSHSGGQLMTKSGAIQPPEPPVLSPPHKPIQFQPPPSFLSPRGPDAMKQPAILPPQNPARGILPQPHGILPTPPMPPNLPSAFLDHGLNNMGFVGTPRVDFDAPGTPMPDFESPRMDFEPPNFVRNDQFSLNQRFVPPTAEHQRRGFDPRNVGGYVGQGRFAQPEMNSSYFNQYDLGQQQQQQQQQQFYGTVHDPSHYLSEQAFYQERARWGRDRRPGDPRNYREYKEMREREKQKEIKDPRLAPRDPKDACTTYRDPRCASADSGNREVSIRDPRLSRAREKSVERPKDVQGSRENRWNPRDRARSGEPSRVRIETSKFDKMYSRTNTARSPPRSQDKDAKTEDEEAFVSPLDSLYNAGEKGKTGRGYGVQNFRIPRKLSGADADAKRKAEKKEELKRAARKRVIELSDSDEGDANVDDGLSADTECEKEMSDKTKPPISSETNDVDTSRIKVVMKPAAGSSVEEGEVEEEEEEFVSEYDRELNKANDPPIEEPSSSSQDDKVADAKEPEVATFKKPAEPAEADSSKAGGEPETPQEKSKDDEPSEQNILAHFFEHLLKSRNKKDKKSALFSLIETFSDSFDDKEIQKIRKIIKVNEDIGESDEESDGSKTQASSKADSQEPNSTVEAVQDEQPVVGSTTEDGQAAVQKDVDGGVQPMDPGETQVNEVSKSTDESDQQPSEEPKSDDSHKTLDPEEHGSLEPVMVSVGERIKNRKRTPAKPKKKFKSELDLLHEDIQDMFIRDGVLTATGKRMCRILKDDPNVLATATPSPPPPPPPTTTPTGEQPKKVPKKRGRKPKLKPNPPDTAQSSMKDMRVLIKKIPDNILSTNSSPARQLRSRTRQISFAETDDEALDVSYDDTSLASSVDAGSDKSESDGEVADDSDEDKRSQTTDGAPRVKTKRRKIHKWASGIIPKAKKKKTAQGKSKENSPDRNASPDLSTVSDVASLNELDVDKLEEADKDYYYDYVNKRKLNCKLCKYTGHLMAGHYLKEHPQSEVLSSRFPPDVAAAAIKDFAENGKVLEGIVKYKLSTKYHYCCRMCGYENFVTPIFFYEHVTTHTGEYRHRCGLCEYFAVTGKTMYGHFSAIHPNEERKSIKKTYTLAIVFGYVCGECNFVQLKEKSVEDHFNIFHSGQKTTVYKVNMSTIIDPQLINANVMSTDLKSIEESSANAEDEQENEVKPPEEEVKKRKKPGPKSKTTPPEKIETPPPMRKKPGPKSKTQKPKPIDEPSTDDEPAKQAPRPPPPEDTSSKDAPTRKRRRSLEKLISEDSGDDLDTIITLSSRTSRAAKEKATAKLKSLMETNEGTSVKRKSDIAAKDSATLSSENIEPEREIDVSLDKPEISEKKPLLVQEMVPPATTKDSLEPGDKDLNVFTCKSDIIQEDAKKIEEDRLRQMDELNKSIGSRPLKLDFINKLSDRLNSEQHDQKSPPNEPIKVKEEPKDDQVTHLYDTIKTIPPITKISNSQSPPVASKKPAFEEQLDVQQPNVNFMQNKSNSLFSNMIEKLQGKINEAAVQQETTSSAAEATASGDGQTSKSPSPPADVFLSIGDLIRATKSDNEIIYSCHANNCYVATKDKMVFQLHCKFGHKDLNITSSLCDKCGVIIEITPDTTLLENLYDHMMFAHSDFITKLSALRMRRLSGDKLSVKKERDDDAAKDTKSKIHDPQPPTAPTPNLQDFEAEIAQHVLRCPPAEGVHAPQLDTPMQTTTSPKTTTAPSEGTLDLAEDNPFSFKIASVMSLADSSDSSTSKTSPIKAAPKPPPLPPLKHVPPLTLIGTPPKQPTAAQPMVVKEAKLTTAELGRPKKAPKALQKFIECPGDLYKCPHFYCMFSTNVRTLLMCHLKAHKCDSATMVPCVYCDMKTPWEHVPMHIDIRHASSKFSCYYCLYRATLKEYVCIHQEQAHPDNDFVIINLPPHKTSKKFSVADSKLDYKTLCEPYRCYCNDEEGGEPVSHEYLYEVEFTNHLKSRHKNKSVICGYPKCGHRIATSMVLNHWAMYHGVCTYQCGYCKTSSKDVTRMYSHFSQMHPNMDLDILVRKNISLPADRESKQFTRELKFTDDAFSLLSHITKIPPVFVTTLGKRTHRSIRMIYPNAAGATGTSDEVSRIENLTPGISSGASLVLTPVTTLHNAITSTHQSPLLLANSNLKLIVASTSGNSDKLYLLPASVVSPPKGTLVTTVAPIDKVAAAQTSTTSESILKVVENQPQEPVRIGDVTLYPPDASAVVQPVFSCSSSSTATPFSGMMPHTSSTLSLIVPSEQWAKPVFTSAKMGSPPEEALKPKITAKIKSITPSRSATTKNQEQENMLGISMDQDGIMGPENARSAPMSEEDILQSAIRSILEQNDCSNTRVDQPDIPSDAPSAADLSNVNNNVIIDPPPLVLLASNPEEPTPEVVTTPSLEHVEIAENPTADDVETNEESNCEVPFADDCDALDPLSEDPLTIIPSLTTDLSSGDPLGFDDATTTIKDPLEVNSELAETNEAPSKVNSMRRSASMVSNSDDESDSGGSERKKRGLIGYQLFRCAVCNLSFSNVKPFRSHISTSLSCKKSGSKAFQCVHCERGMKTPQRLAEHIMTHGVQRFSCSLCNEKFTTVRITRLHLKNRHSVHQTNLVPLKADRPNLETDDFVMKPCQANSSGGKDKETASDSPKPAVEESTYTPDQIETIPIRQIFSSNVKCGLCNYQTKVRVNILRHLQMHLDEKAVPDIAPVNPVPCLEKNEKMFDKMINLAASSVTTSGGRMGGGVKEKEPEENHPEFVPTHRRFVCCAQGCSYLCPEEANLKHHLMALHSDESNFTCAHCKTKIEPADIENVIKHFKLHGLHLYKCHYCSFVHHLKHKVEKHVTDLHLDVAVKVVTVRYMESEPQDFESQEETPTAPPPIATSKFKPWSCCMCKAKYYTKEDIQSHIIKKHNVDTQYKCTLCSFKNDREESFRDHFKEKHPNHEFDIIFVYQKVEEEPPKEEVSTPFDTTPLWQRDKPRVRHIRGILFDEASPQPTKSPKKSKTYGTPSSKVASSSASTSKATPIPPTNAPSTSAGIVTSNAETFSKNLFDCIESVARGTAETLQNKPELGGSEATTSDCAVAKKESPVSAAAAVPDAKVGADEKSAASTAKDAVDNTNDPGNDDVVVVAQSPNVIVIESDDSDAENKAVKSADDDAPKTKDKDSKTNPVAKNRAQKRSGATDLLHEAVKMAKIEETEDDDYVMAMNCSKQNLIKLYGAFGTPHNKQWKCPKCNQFKSKRVADFMFHLYKDFNTYRYQCKVCQDLSITFRYMQDHIKLHQGSTEDIIEHLPRAIKLETWVHMVIREQSLLILKNAPLFKKRPLTSATDIVCYFCNERFMSMPECCEHMLYHWVMMPYQCQQCPNEFYTVYDLKHHHKTEHPDAKLCTDPKGPTLTKAIQCIENPKKRPSSSSPSNPPSPENAPTNKKLRTEPDGPRETILSGFVKNSTHRKKPIPDPTNLNPADVISIEDDEDDLMVVSKTDSRVPNEDDVFACQVCVYVSNSDVAMMKHLQVKHGVRSNKFHVLSRKLAETEAAPKMACNICDQIFSELKLRQHFLENHLEGHTFSPYRYKCGLCSCKYLTPTRVKMHFTRTHGTATKLLYECVVSARKNTAEKKRTKFKEMFCTLCPYSVVCSNTVAIRSHVKGHMKPLVCDHCRERFRYHNEVLAHTSKDHPNLKPSYTTLDSIMKEFTETIKLISGRAILRPDYTESVVAVDESSSVKRVARKSTSAPSKADEDGSAKEFSYYGVPQPEIDLSNVITTFELDELEYTTTAEQVMKMFNMDTYVDLSDCVVDIMPLDSS